MASDQHAVRSVPGYKTGKTGRTGRRPPRLVDADTDTEVALIPITDREGPTREDGALSLSLSLSLSRGGTAQVRTAAGLSTVYLCLDKYQVASVTVRDYQVRDQTWQEPRYSAYPKRVRRDMRRAS